MRPQSKKAGQPNGEQGAPIVEEKKVEKKKAQRITFKDADLLKPNGIQALYNQSKQLKFGSIDETKDLGKVVDLLKAWHFELMPKYNFQYFIERCQSFGSTKLVQSYLSKVRQIHKGEAQWDQNEPDAANRQSTINYQPQGSRTNLDAIFPQRKPSSVMGGDARSVSGMSENLFATFGQNAARKETSQKKQPNSDDSDEDEQLALMLQTKQGTAPAANPPASKAPKPQQQPEHPEQEPGYVYGAIEYEQEELPPGFDSADYN